MMSRLFLLGTPSLESQVAPALFAELRAAANSIGYADGALINARGDRRPGLSIISQGAVRFGNPGLDGSFVVTSILGPGHCFGEMTLYGDLPRTHDAVAMGETIVDQLSPAAFRRVAEANPLLVRAIMGLMARRLHALLEFADDLRRLPLKVQLAKLLLGMAEWRDGAGRVDAGQEDLAAMLGVSRVAIGGALRGLEAETLVKRRYGRVDVLDRTLLRDWIESRVMLAPLVDDAAVRTPSGRPAAERR
jgi:CRP/FNR family cyclic AMP-dependent transcriptional regulator